MLQSSSSMAAHFAYCVLPVCIDVLFGAASGAKSEVSPLLNWFKPINSSRCFPIDRFKAILLMQLFFICASVFSWVLFVLSLLVPYPSFF